VFERSGPVFWSGRLHPTGAMIAQGPVGPVSFDAEDGAITRLIRGDGGTLRDGPLFEAAQLQLASYFEGTGQGFDLPLRPAGSVFQQRFLTVLQDIPYGETRTYGELASLLGVSAQAVGRACGANPIAILIPCHRVLGRDDLGGYSGPGGIDAKVALLRIEGAAGLLI